MNKKVSTLFTAGLLMVGSVFGSANAETIRSLVHETPADKLEAGSQYVMVQDFGVGGVYVYGFELQPDGKIKQVVKTFDADINSDDLKTFAWNITENKAVSGDYDYTFFNVGAQKPLAVTISEDKTSATVNLEPTVATQFVFDNFKSFADPASTTFAAKLSDTPTFAYFVLRGDVAAFETVGSGDIQFYKVESNPVEGDALNKLYNSKGFSFAVKSDAAVVENIFQNVRAIDLDETVNAKENDQRWGFPKGTYFVTKDSYEATKKAKGYDYTDIDNLNVNQNDKEKLKWEFLRSLTFIAVSSTESIEVTGLDRADGQGFELVQISGNDLYDYIGTDLDKLPQNDQLSVKNACFHVEGLSTNDYPYSIRLNDFYYVADADALSEANGKGEDYKQTKNSVNLEVLKHGSPAAFYLTTSKKTAEVAPFIFKFDESNIEKGISFLKTDAPAVYNIRFVSGNNDKTERGKYLTVGFGNEVDQRPVARSIDNLDFLAKGEALADAEALATPVYQFVITKVEGNDVTFTNRESGKSFTVKLYKEREENGKTIYSLSSEANNKIRIVNIKDNSYGTEIVETPVRLNNVEVELIESAVDANSGYLNVANGTLMTIKYARDAHSTSNLWYAAVDAKGNLQKANGSAVLSDDLYSAAQWKLVKVDSVDLDRDYAYNNKNVVAIKGYGDKLKAYLYAFNYVTDGSATDQYLSGEGESICLKGKANADKYIVRKNPNGSVSLIAYNVSEAPFNNKANAFAYGVTESGLVYNVNRQWFKHDELKVYDAERADNELLTFLVNESPEISWKAEEGHVTIQAAGGDYLTMAENNDAIIVNESNADKLYLHVDKKGNGIIPSFYISKGYVEGSNAESERMFLYNPIDSVEYQVNMPYDPQYQLSKDATKAVFKSGKLNETRDTLSLTVKGEVTKKVAMVSNNQQNVWAGLDRFQFQIVETEEGDAMYYIRQPKADKNRTTTWYLANANDNAVWVPKTNTTLPPYTFALEDTTAPTSNETVATSEVKVIAQEGAVVVKNAAGKNVVVSTILGQVVANEVLTSDNATVNVPAGIVVVSVDGESFKINVR